MNTRRFLLGSLLIGGGLALTQLVFHKPFDIAVHIAVVAAERFGQRVDGLRTGGLQGFEQAQALRRELGEQTRSRFESKMEVRFRQILAGIEATRQGGQSPSM